MCGVLTDSRRGRVGHESVDAFCFAVDPGVGAAASRLDLATESVVVDKTARVQGELRVSCIEIAGTFNGVIFAADTAILRATARVDGKLHAKTVLVEPGVALTSSIVCDSLSVLLPSRQGRRGRLSFLWALAAGLSSSFGAFIAVWALHPEAIVALERDVRGLLVILR